MKILIPQKSEMINNPEILDDIEKTVLFIDTVNVSTEYFCISENSYSLPDSIIRNISSNLRDTTNSADYIIITHPKFLSIANQLAAFRESNFLMKIFQIRKLRLWMCNKFIMNFLMDF